MPKRRAVQDHFDSCYHWHECIVGVCLEQAAVMYFVQEKGRTRIMAAGNKKQVEVLVSTQKSGKEVYCVDISLNASS
jgi:hypothetical protein